MLQAKSLFNLFLDPSKIPSFKFNPLVQEKFLIREFFDPGQIPSLRISPLIQAKSLVHEIQYPWNEGLRQTEIELSGQIHAVSDLVWDLQIHLISLDNQSLYPVKKRGTRDSWSLLFSSKKKPHDRQFHLTEILFLRYRYTHQFRDFSWIHIFSLELGNHPTWLEVLVLHLPMILRARSRARIFLYNWQGLAKTSFLSGTTHLFFFFFKL